MLTEHQNDRAIQKSRIEPVIFVPGSSATIQRFNSLFTTLNEEDSGSKNHSVLKVQVNADGSLSYSGHLSSANRQPFIVIGFEKNQDNYPTIQADGQSMETVMSDLQSKYHFRSFSAVGHSNGGLIWTDYLENYYSSNNFHIRTLMTLGTPYNFSESSDTKKTTMLSDFIDGSDNLPTDLSVYSIAGSDDYTDDGNVNVQSVLSGKYIFQKKVAKYTQTTVSGDNAQHSKLPENPEVVNLIRELILDNKAGRRGLSTNQLKKEAPATDKDKN
ncbi:alpha/beta hydrolase [Fructobacillus sp. M1-13]|uniref:Alpha/beta hydrolase n=2 Tax=Fructobacillus papyriferae TaxID=2713171 RepID=A0ABS5QTN6_9LACO|nr:alpha/beta hydrolase [Fructobacillus papyriferae]MBS9335292.1 alpha/beta hydrolase [Fructobacillus papyriferae]MCD2159039.1 alpha/beta hydrolase [Fructobacillus papyriferae]